MIGTATGSARASTSSTGVGAGAVLTCAVALGGACSPCLQPVTSIAPDAASPLKTAARAGVVLIRSGVGLVGRVRCQRAHPRRPQRSPPSLHRHPRRPRRDGILRQRRCRVEPFAPAIGKVRYSRALPRAVNAPTVEPWPSASALACGATIRRVTRAPYCGSLARRVKTAFQSLAKSILLYTNRGESRSRRSA